MIRGNGLLDAALATQCGVKVVLGAVALPATCCRQIVMRAVDPDLPTVTQPTAAKLSQELRARMSAPT